MTQEITQVWNIIDNQIIISEHQKLKQGEEVFEIGGAIEIEPYEIPSLPGCKLGADFPGDSEFFSRILQYGQTYFNRFPECCDGHRKLKNASWFRIEKYTHTPNKIAISIGYLDYCTRLSAKFDNWQQRITDYIEILGQSFGQLPEGYGPPVGLHQFVEACQLYFKEASPLRDLQNELIQRFLIDEYLTPRKQEEKKGKHSIKVLLEIYKQWLNLFPFNLSFFSEQKSHYSTIRPFIKGEIKVNLYNGLAKAQLIPVDEFPETLLRITKELLSKIDTTSLFGSINVSDAIQKEIEIVKETHKLAQTIQLRKHFKNSEEIISTILGWLKNERQLFADLRNLIAEQNKQQQTTAIEQPKSSTQHLDAFMEEVQRLDVKVQEFYFDQSGPIREISPDQHPGLPYKAKKYLTLDHYGQSESNYNAEINTLQQKALNEALRLDQAQIERLIKRIELLIQKYERFWPKYSELIKLHQDGKRSNVDLEILIYPFFIVNKHENGEVTDEFIFGIHDAAMFKSGALHQFMHELKGSALQETQPANEVASIEVNFTDKVGPFKDDYPIKGESLLEIVNETYKLHFDQFVQLLRTEEDPVIDYEGKMIPGSQKGALVVWYQCLNRNGIIETHVNDNMKAKLLAAFFGIESLSPSLFRQENKRAKEKYEYHLRTETTKLARELAKPKQL